MPNQIGNNGLLRCDPIQGYTPSTSLTYIPMRALHPGQTCPLPDPTLPKAHHNAIRPDVID